MSGKDSQSLLYLDALMDANASYTTYDILPGLQSINSTAEKSLQILQSMAGIQQSLYSNESDDYIRGRWFRNGSARAYMGYSESMNAMGDYVGNLNFKTISLSNSSDIPVFYGDLVGVSSSIKSCSELNLAKKLANITASSKIFDMASRPETNSDNPQYLLPARYSAYRSLANSYPIYNKLFNIVRSPNNRLFRAGSNIRDWLYNADQVIPIGFGAEVKKTIIMQKVA
ncbi:thiamine pyridinylase [Clostridium sp. W14A]|nr:thiamine pyridinylase [Clostridium sp. W14A]